MNSGSPTMSHGMCVLIATAGRSELLGETLRSFADCVLPDCYREAIIVENGPPQGTKEIVAAAPSAIRARYVHVPTPGKSNALNEVIKTLADDCLIVFADDDILVSPLHLTIYDDAFRRHPSRHYFGGPVKARYEETPPEYLVPLLPNSARGWQPETGSFNPSKDFAFLGFNWAARCGELKERGMFDVNVGPGGTTGGTGQEITMQRSFFRSGSKPVYLPDALVRHFVPKTRCSEPWVIKRWKRYGITRGYERNYLIVLFHLLTLITTSLLLAIPWFASRRRNITKLKCKLNFIAGWLRGWRVG